MSEPVKILTGQDWREFLLSPAAETTAEVVTWTMGTLLLLGLLAALGIGSGRSWLRWPLYAASGVLLFETFCHFLNVGYQIPMVMEHALRSLTPGLFAAISLYGWRRGLRLALLLATASTFVGHGIYAMGAGVPVPGHFVDMFHESLGVSQATALTLLLVAGILDQLVAVGIFLPLPYIRSFSLLYCSAWGTLTSLARPFSYIRFDPLFWDLTHIYLPEFIIRLPHFLVPFALWLWYLQQRSAKHPA